MSRAANAANPIQLGTASGPDADGTPLATADDWFAASAASHTRSADS